MPCLFSQICFELYAASLPTLQPHGPLIFFKHAQCSFLGVFALYFLYLECSCPRSSCGWLLILRSHFCYYSREIPFRSICHCQSNCPNFLHFSLSETVFCFYLFTSTPHSPLKYKPILFSIIS